MIPAKSMIESVREQAGLDRFGPQLKIVVREDLFRFDTPGSLGVVTNTLFSMCRWADLYEPMRLFAHGSSGIVIQGPPTPRNVILPDGVDRVCIMSSDGRLTDIPTNISCFFIRDRETREIMQEMTLEEAIAYADAAENK